MHEFTVPELRRGFRVGFAIVMLLVTAVPFALLVAAAAGSMQVRYQVTANELLVDTGSWLDGKRVVSLASVREASLFSLRGARRSRGTALPGYCTGRYTYEAIGAVWQATDCSARTVLVRADGEELPLVVTPPDPEAFLRAMNARAPLSVALPPADAALLHGVLALGAFLVLTIDISIISLCLLGPGRMRYRVDVPAGELTVRTLFSSSTFPLSNVSARHYDARPSVRLLGTAMPGYYTGRYRESGQMLRVYATTLEAGVLLEGPARIYLSPEDRRGFLTALRDGGATVDTLSD